jgi:flagellar L-ring protein precursor FlgH
MSRIAVLLIPLVLSGCGSWSRLSEIGSPPRMTAAADPTQAKNYTPITLPMPNFVPGPAVPASLWRAGARDFLKDQRASEVGDLVTVVVNVADTAALQDNTAINRASNENLGVPNILGLASLFPHIFGKANLNQTNSGASNNTGSADNTTTTGQVARNEIVALRLAGEVIQVLPNGNLVVVARQEMRVNSELRILTVSGVIRPEDIASDNTIAHDRMAEARISYGGRGDLTYAQQKPWGQQVLGAIAPF